MTTCRSEEIVFERTPDVGEIGSLDSCNVFFLGGIGGDFGQKGGLICLATWQPGSCSMCFQSKSCCFMFAINDSQRNSWRSLGPQNHEK